MAESAYVFQRVDDQRELERLRMIEQVFDPASRKRLLQARAHERGFVETIFGRRIHFPEINTRNPSMRGFLERAAINAPIQGSAADIIRRAMIRMPAALQAAQLSVRMLLQVHDELVFDAGEADVAAALPVIANVMEKAAEPAVELAVPIHVDAKAADNWEAAH